VTDPLARINVPAKGNQKLEKFMSCVNADPELTQLWKSANVNAVDRAGMSDHGPVHVQIVANAAYKMLRLLVAAEVPPSIVKDHGLENDDAAIVVVGGALLHDIGMAVQRENHELLGASIAWDTLRRVLSPIYEPGERTIVAADILHCMIAHQTDEICLTIESGIVKVADALDMTHGRSRIPFEAGEVNIHSVSAQAIKSVELKTGILKPIRVEIQMNNYAGIFQLDELLKRKLRTSTISECVEVSATITGDPGRDLGVVYSL